ncbi:hypothetical protein BSU04_25975 [Caballeronia sordidicola]|uniref:Uncharacterized protein n=1 Tax=Caballeronia sordidicola TaxID=196367 RepID=A0A226WWW1_CABSO|nr:hypothetical protein BSU04_25975 [Caballeronia sordidicola]
MTRSLAIFRLSFAVPFRKSPSQLIKLSVALFDWDDLIIEDFTMRSSHGIPFPNNGFGLREMNRHLGV